MDTIEVNALDLRLAHTRQRDASAEKLLLSLIMERDILDPLQISIYKDIGRVVLLALSRLLKSPSFCSDNSLCASLWTQR